MPEHDNRSLEPGEEFDRLLRSSLESYADAGPHSGLAQRILARIAVEGDRERPRRTIRWAIALPVAACLIIAIVLLASKPLHRSADGANQARVTLPKSAEVGRSADKSPPVKNPPLVATQHTNAPRTLRHLPRTATTASVERLPKLDVFPTPQPLTSAEQALVVYVAHAPEEERKSLVEERLKMDEPLTIAALEIKPLEPPEPQGN